MGDDDRHQAAAGPPDAAQVEARPRPRPRRRRSSGAPGRTAGWPGKSRDPAEASHRSSCTTPRNNISSPAPASNEITGHYHPGRGQKKAGAPIKKLCHRFQRANGEMNDGQEEKQHRPAGDHAQGDVEEAPEWSLAQTGWSAATPNPRATTTRPPSTPTPRERTNQRGLISSLIKVAELQGSSFLIGQHGGDQRGGIEQGFHPDRPAVRRSRRSSRNSATDGPAATP